MKSIILNNGFNSQDDYEIRVEVARILEKNSQNSFDTNEDSIIEYTDEDSIYWNIVNVNYNEDGTIKSVDLDC
jgi:hypothetical protein